MQSANTKEVEKWLSSKEMQQQLKISACELMHLRQSGALKFKKIRNAFYYQKVSRLD